MLCYQEKHPIFLLACEAFPLKRSFELVSQLNTQNLIFSHLLPAPSGTIALILARTHKRPRGAIGNFRY